MIDIDARTKADDEPARFPSMASLEAANNELLKRRRQNGVTAELLAEAEAFVERAQATGALLDADADRWAGQSLLDYWVNVLVRAGQKPAEIVLADFNPSLAPVLEDSLCPYVGLQPFGEADQDRFFGRKNLIEEAGKWLKENRWLAVVGPSGSGKSSFVLAGLLPGLEAGDGTGSLLCYRPIVPGPDPLASLASLVQPTDSTDTESTRQQAQSFRSSQDRLSQIIREAHSEPALIAVDQFEEIFTLCADDLIRRAFIGNLISVVQAGGRKDAVVITMRSDFETYVAKLPDLQALFAVSSIRVTPLSALELREAIEKPALRIGLKFEEGLIEHLVTEILGEPAGLPLLQFTLLKLWEKRKRNIITWEAFHLLGSCREALARSADAVYGSLIPEEQITIKRILLRMVRPGEGLEVLNNRVRREALYLAGEPRERIDHVLEKLIKAGLVRETQRGTQGDAQLEVAHEALIRNWPRLVGWLEEERVSLRKRLRLTDTAKQWDASARDGSLLLRGSLLDEALGFDDLNTLESVFVQRSRTQRRTLKGLRIAAVLVIIALLAGSAVFYYTQRNEARAQRDLAFSRQLAAQGLIHVDSRLDLALLLSLEAGRVENTVEARGSLLSELQQSPQVIAYLSGLAAPAVQLTFDVEGKTLTSGNLDGSTTSWSTITRQPLAQPNAVQTEKARLVGFSPDGSVRATYSGGESVRIFEVATGRKLSECAVEEQPSGLAMSPTLRVVAIAATDRIELWDISHGKLLSKLPEPEDLIAAMQFTPNGEILASGGFNGTTQLWNVKTGRKIARLPSRTQDGPTVRALAFSPDGKVLATGYADGSITLWDVTTHRGLGQPLKGHSSSITALAFTPDGEMLGSGGEDNTIVLWRGTPGEGLFRHHIELTGSPGRISTLAFSPDKKTLASGSAEKIVVLWNLIGAPRLMKRLIEPNDSLLSVAFSPDGRLVASGSVDNRVILWDVASGRNSGQFFIGPEPSQPPSRLRPTRYDLADTRGVRSLVFCWDNKTLAANNGSKDVILCDVDSKQIIKELAGHEEVVTTLALSSDGRVLASGSRDKTVILWDVAKREMLRTLRLHEGVVTGLAFSPDAKMLVSVGRDNLLVLWDVPSGQRIRQLSVEAPDSIDASDSLLSSVRGRQGLRSVAFSPDGKMLAFGASDNSITLWDVANWQPVGEALTQHTREVTSLAFSPEKRTRVLASAASDGRIVLWDVDARQPVGPLTSGPSSGRREILVAFHPSGKSLASVSRIDRGITMTVSVWDVDLESWKRRACVIANRNLTPAEWKQYLRDKPKHATCPELPFGDDAKPGSSAANQ